ncbi:sugar transferase [Qingshengfaniella alkalisoli]|uniref:Sugar transferase n=1 Tax=Qingshengfaniella alkalisoli TaxID=2599296 RepID=A0A5B8IWZ1_9RHOB|nr:sugar transferase [Qingshengfaniella alkalisoli]QDY70103.1 sugar transferase [Qingshengfaniella alkalisoli]
MTWTKRIFDVMTSIILLILFSPVMLGVTLAILLRDGGPVLFRSERMKTPQTGFTLLKFRTMRDDPEDGGVTGGDKANRITHTGRFMRKTRLDELPQLINVLKGDISLVGPRPPLRVYVEAAPVLYAKVLKSRPGLTGLATLLYHSHENWILSGCNTSTETHDAYLRRCVPTKGRLDLIYQAHSSVCFDLWILWRTFRALID